jgi:hypothetical protein
MTMQANGGCQPGWDSMNLDLDGTIWLNVSRKLLGFHKWFFTPFEDMPKEVFEEFKHHSHTHPSVTVTSSTTTHEHGDYLSSNNVCGVYGALNHAHWEWDNPADSHSHSFTVTFAAANLGSPNWYEHVHALGGSVALGGSAHTHSGQGADDGSYCGYSTCTSAHPHFHTDNLKLASGGAAHNNHSISGNSAYANSAQTPESHSHTFSFTSGNGGSHSHAYSGSCAAKACYLGGSHVHSYSGTSPTMSHNHTVSGTSGLGGESAAVALRRLLVGVGL